jgi:hypothetical protein
MNLIYRAIIFIMLFALSGCMILPIPHRRLQVYGVQGSIVDPEGNPIPESAAITCDGNKHVVNLQGEFEIPPIYSWHGAILIGPLSYSLFPFLDMPFLQPGNLLVEAPGYQSCSICINPSRISEPKEAEDALFVNAEIYRNYLDVGVIVLEPWIDPAIMSGFIEINEQIDDIDSDSTVTLPR